MILETKWVRAALCAVLAVVVLAAAVPAEAQQILAQAPAQHDRVRLSGFIWRGKPKGVLDLPEFEGIPGFEGGVNFTDSLGFADPANGWIFEANVAAARRHRFIFEFAELENNAAELLDLGGIGTPFGNLVIATDTTIKLGEFHAYYNYLLVASPQVEFGVVGGVGYFNGRIAAISAIGRVTGGIKQAFPTFGGVLMANPKGPVRGYFELTGFPRVSVDEFSGWQLDVVARVEVILFDTVGVMLGYRRYRLVFDNEGNGAALDLRWEGLTFGGQVKF